jgi:hypothetical protein
MQVLALVRQSLTLPQVSVLQLLTVAHQSLDPQLSTVLH